MPQCARLLGQARAEDWPWRGEAWYPARNGEDRLPHNNLRGAFFNATTFALQRVDSLFDFAWPTAAALWNLRWQVRGFVDEVPDASQDDLNGRFAAGSGIRGLDLRKACITTTWEDQQEIFAGFILTNALAIYEHWSDEILAAFGEPAPRGGHPLQLDQPALGVQAWVAGKQTPLSTLNDTQFFPAYRSHRKYSWPLIANLMKAFRYFKQGRNALIHRGGIANAVDEQAYLDFAPVSGRASLGMRGSLEHHPFVAGQRVKLKLRGVVGFCDILIRLMRSIDAEASRSLDAESITKERLARGRGIRWMLSGDEGIRAQQIKQMCRAGGLPWPVDTQVVYQFMLDAQMLRM